MSTRKAGRGHLGEQDALNMVEEQLDHRIEMGWWYRSLIGMGVDKKCCKLNTSLILPVGYEHGSFSFRLPGCSSERKHWRP
jgi:hypothetical protein